MPKKSELKLEYTLPSFQEDLPEPEPPKKTLLKPSRLSQKRPFFAETESFIEENFKTEVSIPSLPILPPLVTNEVKVPPTEVPSSYAYHLEKEEQRNISNKVL